MTDSKKSAHSASSSELPRTEAKQGVFNPPNAVPHTKKSRSQRYLYGGMLFPSHIISEKETQSLEREAK